MRILSNGQAITVSSERARYHATRLNLLVDAKTSHLDLYPLVDVLVQNVKDGTAFVFSGHTLGDPQWRQGLTETDYQTLSKWLNESHVRYEIEGARRRLIYDESPSAIVTHDYPERLYSRLRRRIQAMPPASLPASQWRQTLLNLRTQGVGQEELHWSGVMGWLETRVKQADPRLSRQEVLDRIDFFPIRLYVTNEVLDRAGAGGRPRYRDRYRHLSLHGGEDYREWLVSLPDYTASYFGPHFTERNVLIHIRGKTRYDTAGRKMLFIEEIQSDWHQQGHKTHRNLSRLRVPAAPFRKSWVGLGLKLMLIRAVEEGFDGLAWADGRIQSCRYRAGLAALHRIYDEQLGRALLRLSSPWQGELTQTTFESRVPWCRLERLKKRKTLLSKHGNVCRSYYGRQAVLDILAAYQTNCLVPTPAFILPRGMAAYIASEGLPLFGEQC